MHGRPFWRGIGFRDYAYSYTFERTRKSTSSRSYTAAAINLEMTVENNGDDLVEKSQPILNGIRRKS